MRDIAIVLVFGVAILFALRNPFVGILTFFWISIMNPHRFSWGFAYNLPLAMIASAATLVSCVINSGQLRFPAVRETYLFFLLWVWVTLTTLTAFYPKWAWIQWDLVTKIFVMTLIAMLVVNTRKRLLVFSLALVSFVGFMGVKGAVFGILTGGKYQIWGPPDSFLKDNNSIGLAMVMLTPLCFFLKDLLPKRWQRNALFGVGLCMVISAALTYSRGALLGLVAIGFLYFLEAKGKFRILLVGTVLVAIGLSLVPGKWFDRMSTIKTYEEDKSANMRLNSWQMAYNLAKDNFMGGGFDCFTMEQYYNYAPDPELGRRKSGGASTAHSIYFEVLAMHGFPGLAIYLATLFSMLLSLRKLRRKHRNGPDAAWVSAYSNAFTVSIVGFMTTGAFLSRGFFDLFWAIFGAAVCFRFIVVSEESRSEAGLDAVRDEDPGVASAALTSRPN